MTTFKIHFFSRGLQFIGSERCENSYNFRQYIDFYKRDANVFQ